MTNDYTKAKIYVLSWLETGIDNPSVPGSSPGGTTEN